MAMGFENWKEISVSENKWEFFFFLWFMISLLRIIDQLYTTIYINKRSRTRKEKQGWVNKKKDTFLLESLYKIKITN